MVPVINATDEFVSANQKSFFHDLGATWITSQTFVINIEDIFSQ